MSYREAKKLLAPGDIVYIPASGKIVRAVVVSIQRDHLITDQDNLFFDEVGSIWFLTLCCAVEALKEVKARNGCTD